MRGRIVPIVGNKQSRKGAAILNENLDRMKVDIDVAEAGRRVQTESGEWMGTKSTFPDHFRKSGFKTKNEWLTAYRRAEGPKFQRILKHAANDVNFRVATKQVYDNHLVLFRTIDHKVRPIRVKSADEYNFYNWKESKRG